MFEIVWSNHRNWVERESKLTVMNGYGYATDRILTSLRNLGYTVSSYSKSADVQIWMDQPHHWEWIPGVYRIGYHPWESTALKEGWLEKMNECHEIWTPSPLIADWYRAMGVKPPVHVFQHGVDELWSPKKREWDSGTFNILHVGADAVRRASREAMQSIRLAFPRNKDVTLNMKMISSGWNIGKLPRINFINSKMSVEELLQMYYDNHLMLGISYGEGFGLTPLQGMASGMPVISQPAWAPYAEYLDPNLSIGSKMVRSPWPSVHPGNMLAPSMDDLVDRLRYAYDNYESVAEEACRRADEVRAAYQWNTLTSTMFKDLEKRLEKS